MWTVDPTEGNRNIGNSRHRDDIPTEEVGLVENSKMDKRVILRNLRSVPLAMQVIEKEEGNE
jgi:hypothetical protein